MKLGLLLHGESWANVDDYNGWPIEHVYRVGDGSVFGYSVSRDFPMAIVNIDTVSIDGIALLDLTDEQLSYYHIERV